MYLEVDFGPIINDCTEENLRDHIPDCQKAILSKNQDTYLQCYCMGPTVSGDDSPDYYALEYQDGSAETHYRCTSEVIYLEPLLAAFCKYLQGDSSWQTGFQWNKVSSGFRFIVRCPKCGAARRRKTSCSECDWLLYPSRRDDWGKKGHCPGCGFAYRWDGVQCSHCGHGAEQAAGVQRFSTRRLG